LNKSSIVSNHIQGTIGVRENRYFVVDWTVIFDCILSDYIINKQKWAVKFHSRMLIMHKYPATDTKKKNLKQQAATRKYIRFGIKKLTMSVLKK
jgi:hypothetical protein